jgi:hypothetical protein
MVYQKTRNQKTMNLKIQNPKKNNPDHVKECSYLG